MALDYIGVLTDTYGMTELESYVDVEACSWRMQKGNDGNAAVRLDLDRQGDDTWEVRFTFGDHVTLVQAETWEAPAEEPESAPEVSDPAILPDFLEHDTSDSFRQGTTSSNDVVAFLSEADSVRDVTEGYVQLLLDMGYWVSDTEEKSNQFMDVYRWYLTHDDVGGTAVSGKR